MRSVRICFAGSMLLMGSGCSTPDRAPLGTPWEEGFIAPGTLKTPRMVLEPLGPQHAELDHGAFMSSREHLQRTLHWGDWPSPDTTVEDNRRDLERHAREFEQREAYAYAVLSRNRQRSLGCVYINPVPDEPRAVRVAYWIVADQLPRKLDVHLMDAVLQWFEADWPIDRAEFTFHRENARGIRIARRAHLNSAVSSSDDHQRFIWTRAG